ncbi:bone morphogenetic protein 2-like [Arapaima gigas]
MSLLVLAALLATCSSWPQREMDEPQRQMDEPQQMRSEALRRLLGVFGMEAPPNGRGHKQPPQYMVDLFNAVADGDGVTRDPDLLEGNTVRSFFDKLHSDQIKLLFNLSSVTKNEKVLAAELHLFKLRSQPLTFNRHHFYQVSVYQLLDTSGSNSTQEKKLLSSKLVPVHSSGWEVFSITHAVRSWMADKNGDLALTVMVRVLGGSQTDSRLLRFASGRHHHHSKQPMLVLFSDDGRRSTSLGTKPNPVLPGYVVMPCQRVPLYVDFEEIGWSSWIVSPRGYNAYHCTGSCSFPLGQNMRATNHATVQSIIHTLKVVPGVQTPCCVPDRLFSINLLYFDEEENVVLKQYDDMVAGSCGCH